MSGPHTAYKYTKPLPSQSLPAGSSTSFQISVWLSLKFAPSHDHWAPQSCQLLSPSSPTPAWMCPLLLRLSCFIPPYKQARPGMEIQQTHSRCSADLLFWWHQLQFHGFPALYLTTKPLCLSSHLTSCFLLRSVRPPFWAMREGCIHL